MTRIYLSPPHMTGEERLLVDEAFDTNWIAPLGPHVNLFEEEMCEKLGASHATALSSGTAALHLALLMLEIGMEDEVYCSDLTFAATANAIRYVGANPVFIDADRSTWNMSPELLEETLKEANRRNKLPKLVIVVDLYGQCADYDTIRKSCGRYDIPLIEDAAEALGATYKGKMAGTFGEMAVLSFNGNKIITSGGGGMLLSPHAKYAEQALYLATQARDPAPHYQHSQIGYNYRMSNVLAAIGRGQLRALDHFIEQRRRNYNFYHQQLSEVAGIEFMQEAEYGRANRWLTCITVDEETLGITKEDIRIHLESKNIESRPVWKPMHMQPVFKEFHTADGTVSEELFNKGLCLPSGSELNTRELKKIVSEIKFALKTKSAKKIMCEYRPRLR